MLKRFIHQYSEVCSLLAAIALVICLGTLGFVIIEGWNAFDAFYMTVTTITTVGYGEVHPLSRSGRWFAVFLIASGVGLAMVSLTTLSQKVLQQQLGFSFKKKRMRDAIARLEGHTILCGYGRLSRIAAQSLRDSKVSVIIVEKDEVRGQEAVAAGFLVLVGDATTDESLISAGVKRAKRLVSLLPKDSDNLYVILTSREMNPNLFILSRAEDDAGEKRLRRAGADRIVSPYRVGGQKIADRLMRPLVTDFIDLTGNSSIDLSIEEIRIPENSPLKGATLRDSEMRQRTNVIIAAIIPAEGDMIFNPSGETVIQAGATLIGLGRKKDFLLLEQMMIGDSR